MTPQPQPTGSPNASPHSSSDTAEVVDPSGAPSPLTLLNRWVDQLLVSGVTQYCASDDFEALISELDQQRGHRAISKRLRRVARCFPRDLLSSEAQSQSGGLMCGWGWSGWGRRQAANLSDRSLYMPHSPSEHAGVGWFKRGKTQSWVTQLLSELGALCALIQMTERSEALTEETWRQHQRRLGLGPSRLSARHGVDVSGSFLSLGESSTAKFAKRRQVMHWSLHLETGEVFMSRVEDSSTRERPRLAPPDRGEFFQASAKALSIPAPRQLLWREISDELGPERISRSLLNTMKWSASWRDVSEDWSEHLARDPFSLRPLFALRGARAAARRRGELSADQRESYTLPDKPLSAGAVEPPMIQAYLCDREGVSSRIYAPVRTCWEMIEESERGALMVIGEWGGRGFRPIAWCVDEEVDERSAVHDVHLRWVDQAHAPYKVHLSDLEGSDGVTFGPATEALTQLSQEREDRVKLVERYSERASVGLGADLPIPTEVIRELRRDLTALWLWGRAELPISAPPELYSYRELLRVTGPALEQSARLLKEDRARRAQWAKSCSGSPSGTQAPSVGAVWGHGAKANIGSGWGSSTSAGSGWGVNASASNTWGGGWGGGPPSAAQGGDPFEDDELPF